MLLKNQIEKLNEAHMMTKLLTIEKMIKAKQEHEGLEKRRNSIFRIREEKRRASLLNQSRKQHRTMQLRQMSLYEGGGHTHKNESKYATIEENRNRAERVREEKQRRKERLQRYEVLPTTSRNSRTT